MDSISPTRLPQYIRRLCRACGPGAAAARAHANGLSGGNVTGEALRQRARTAARPAPRRTVPADSSRVCPDRPPERRVMSRVGTRFLPPVLLALWQLQNFYGLVKFGKQSFEAAEFEEVSLLSFSNSPGTDEDEQLFVSHLETFSVFFIQKPGGRGHPPLRASRCFAKSSVVRSSKYGPTICMPIGSPLLRQPTGTTVAGK